MTGLRRPTEVAHAHRAGIVPGDVVDLAGWSADRTFSQLQ
jgi:hypothetical protein